MARNKNKADNSRAVKTSSTSPAAKQDEAPKKEEESTTEEEEPVSDPEATAGLEPATTSGIGAGKVEKIPLDAIDQEDTIFMFRAILRVSNLQKSLKEEGLQIPIIVRRTQGKKKYQIISGFRRTAAATALKWPEIAAINRTGLSDEDAFKAAVLENTARKTYSDIDRAYIIKAYKDRGYGGEEVGKVMGLTKRQTNNIRSLLDLPQDVQEAIDDADQHFGTTHALVLKQMASKYPKVDLMTWVAVVNAEELSVSQLKRRVNKEHGGELNTGFSGLFQAKGTDWRKGEVRFAPVKVKFSALSDADRKKLRGELERVLKKLGQ